MSVWRRKDLGKKAQQLAIRPDIRMASIVRAERVRRGTAWYLQSYTQLGS
jgi:hypothetical protein